ncbi:hypothetical protein ABID42_004138 [Arcicella rosea]
MVPLIKKPATKVKTLLAGKESRKLDSTLGVLGF